MSSKSSVFIPASGLPQLCCFYWVLPILLVVFAGNTLAQNVEIGVVGGGYWNSAFSNRTFDSGLQFINSAESGRSGVVVGARVAVRVRQRVYVNLDSLYKPLYYFQRFTVDGVAPAAPARATVVTWQFPVLAQYRFGSGSIQPYLEGGPSFRASGNLNSAAPSWYGFSAGAGLRFPVGNFAVSPGFRYTRWAEDGRRADIRSKQDQWEVLVAATHSAPGGHKLLGRRWSLGALVGLYATERSRTETESSLDPATGLSRSFSFAREPQRYFVSPVVQFSLTPRVALEVNAITRGHNQTITTDQTIDGVRRRVETRTSIYYPWEFPVLARYRFSDGKVRPFVAAGPAFRLPREQAGAWVSNYGIAAGTGVEIPWMALRFAPQVRYTRWGKDRARFPESGVEPDTGYPRNQLYLMLSATF